VLLTRYYSGDQIKKNEMDGTFIARMGERRGAYSVLVAKPEGKKPLGKPRSTWEDNNNIYLLQLCCYPVAVVSLHVHKI